MVLRTVMSAVVLRVDAVMVGLTIGTTATFTLQRKGNFTELGASVGKIIVILYLFMTSRQKISSLH